MVRVVSMHSPVKVLPYIQEGLHSKNNRWVDKRGPSIGSTRMGGVQQHFVQLVVDAGLMLQTSITNNVKPTVTCTVVAASAPVSASRSRVACAEEIACLIEREGPKVFSGRSALSFGSSAVCDSFGVLAAGK